MRWQSDDRAVLNQNTGVTGEFPGKVIGSPRAGSPARSAPAAELLKDPVDKGMELIAQAEVDGLA